MTKRKIYSRRYERLMAKGWDKRHTLRNQKRYGVWRWRGMYEYRGLIVPLLERAQGIIDFGGALGPLGFGSLVVDVRPPVVMKGGLTLEQVERMASDGVDVVFSSHTLEHVDDFSEAMSDRLSELRAGGHMILHLPSDRNAKHWHPAHRPEHKRLFALRNMHDSAYVRIDRLLVSMGMELEECDYCGDASIMVIAKKT